MNEISSETLLKHMSGTFYRTNLQGILVHLSPFIKKQLGYSTEELIGKPLAKLYAKKKQRQHFLEKLKKSTDPTISFQTFLRHKDGKKVRVETSSSYYYDMDGNISGVEGIVRDISIEYQAQKAINQKKKHLKKLVKKHTADLEKEIRKSRQKAAALKKSGKMLKLVMDNIPQAVFWKDRNFIVGGCNQKFAKDVGFTDPKDVIGKTDYDCLVVTEQADSFRHDDQQVMSSGEPLLHKCITFRKPDGEYLSQDTTKVPLHSENGDIIGIVCTYEDITDYKRLELALQENNEQLTALIDASPDCICFKDGKGKLLLANEAHLNFFQLTNIEYKGRTSSQLAEESVLYMNTFSVCMETDEQAWKDGKLSRRHETIILSDGQKKVFDVIKIPLFHADGMRKGLVVQAHDITDRLRVEENLRQEIIAGKRAAEVMREKNKEVEETNIALNVLIKQNRDVVESVQQNVLAQLEQAVIPYIQILRQQITTDNEKEYLDIITKHIHEVGSSFVKKLNSPDLSLTKKEVLVADMVRQGKSTLEIAGLFNLQVRTVEVYRTKIRKKLRLNNKKISLMQYLRTNFTS